MEIENEARVVENLLRGLLREAFWNVNYHERSIRELAQRRPGILEVFRRWDFGFTEDEAARFHCETEDEDVGCTPDELIKFALGSLRGPVDHHEQSLVKAHQRLAAVKITAMRLGMDIDIAEVEADIKRRLANGEPLNG